MSIKFILFSYKEMNRNGLKSQQSLFDHVAETSLSITRIETLTGFDSSFLPMDICGLPSICDLSPCIH